jgi:hypothetical protein
MNIEHLSDEVLSAYLDGELSPEARIALERQLLSEPGARVRLERFRENDARLRRAFALPGVVEHGLIEGDVIKSGPIEVDRTEIHRAQTDPLRLLLMSEAPAAVVSSSQPLPRRWRRYAAPVGLAMAATVAGLAIGLGWRAGQVPSGEGQGDDPRLSAALQGALDRQLSGDVRHGTRILFSFRRADGAACRQFETMTRDGNAEGVACRPPGKAWSLVVWHPLGQSAEGYRPAGAGDSPVDAVVEQIDASGPLSVQDETQAISSGW